MAKKQIKRKSNKKIKNRFTGIIVAGAMVATAGLAVAAIKPAREWVVEAWNTTTNFFTGKKYKDEIKDLQEQIKEFGLLQQEMQEKLEEKNNQLDLKNIELANKENQIQGLLQTKSQNEAEILQLKQDKTLLENSLAEKQDELEAKLLQIAQLEASGIATAEELADAYAEIAVIQAEVKALEDAVALKESVISFLDSQVQDAGQYISELKGDIVTLENEISSLTTEKEDLQLDIQSLQNSISNLTSEIEYLYTSFTEVTNQNEYLKSSDNYGISSIVPFQEGSLILEQNKIIPHSTAQLLIYSPAENHTQILIPTENYVINGLEISINNEYLKERLALEKTVDSTVNYLIIYISNSYIKTEAELPIIRISYVISPDDFSEMQQLSAPEITNVDYLQQTLSFNPVLNADKYELFVDGVSYGEKDYIVPTDLKELPVNDGSVVGVKALGNGSNIIDSEIATTIISFPKYSTPTLEFIDEQNGIIKISNIDTTFNESYLLLSYYNAGYINGGSYTVSGMSNNELILSLDEVFKIIPQFIPNDDYEVSVSLPPTGFVYGSDESNKLTFTYLNEAVRTKLTTPTLIYDESEMKFTILNVEYLAWVEISENGVDNWQLLETTQSFNNVYLNQQGRLYSPGNYHFRVKSMPQNYELEEESDYSQIVIGFYQNLELDSPTNISYANGILSWDDTLLNNSAYINFGINIRSKYTGETITYIQPYEIVGNSYDISNLSLTPGVYEFSLSWMLQDAQKGYQGWGVTSFDIEIN